MRPRQPAGRAVCSGCGAPLAPPSEAARKTVTVVFCDLVGFTSLSEKEDPEAIRRAMGRYFEAARAEFERHGGSVEKYIGDAVMAVFGIPQVHEDDAIRAVRAAANVRDRVSGLADELVGELGHGLEIRIGVNTGEVVATDSAVGHGFVTGDPVNVAARLQQSAQPGEIVLGDRTHQLVRSAVDVESSGDLTLKGKSSTVPGWRLIRIKDVASAIQLQPAAGLVGRRDELAAIAQVLERSAASRRCELVTIVGEPGIGKSRLAREFLDSARTRARVVVGRCLSYGEGITFWPLIEIVRELTADGIAIEQLMAGADDAQLIGARVRGAIGLGQPGPAEEIAWAFRRLFESIAREKQVILVIDDVHWAEPMLLDLLDHVVDHATDAAIVVLCMTRPELLERRPAWAVRDNATLLTLRPLAAMDAAQLVDAAAASGGQLSPDERDRLIAAAEGNPLFLEQLIAHRADKSSTGVVPPTVEALLAARIDALDPDQRAVLVRAAVEGRDFHSGAVLDLSPDVAQADIDASLGVLMRKGLIEAGVSQFDGEVGLRFGHQLIRDAAYAAASKELRANLHRRHAGWLERRASGRTIEFEEIIGYHLELAARLLIDLRQPDQELADRAAQHLAHSGERALQRGDTSAARSLLERAAQLYGDRTPANVWYSLGVARMQGGDFARAQEALTTAAVRADATGDLRTAARAAMERVALSTWAGGIQAVDIQSEAERVIRTFQSIGDDLGLAKAWLNIVQVHNTRLQLAEWERAATRAMEHARRAGSASDEAEAIFWRCSAMLLGVKPVGQAIATCREMLNEARGPLAEAALMNVIGPLSMMAGDVIAGRALFARAQQIHLDLGMSFVAVNWKTALSLGELGAAEFVAAEEVLRSQVRTLEEMGDRSGLSTSAGLLAHALCAQHRHDEAVQYLEMSARMTEADDLINDILISAGSARVRAAAGDAEAAVDAGSQAVEIADRTDAVDLQALARIALSDAFGAAGRPDDEVIALGAALKLYEWRGAPNMAALVQRRLDELVPASIGKQA